MKVKFFLIVLLVLFMCSLTYAATQFIDAHLYMHDANTVTLAWDSQPSGSIPDYYDIKVTCIESGQVWMYQTTGLSIVLSNAMGLGHFKFAVRACMAGGDCTVWTESTGPGAAIWNNGAFVRNDSWIIYWRLGAPTSLSLTP